MLPIKKNVEDIIFVFQKVRDWLPKYPIASFVIFLIALGISVGTAFLFYHQYASCAKNYAAISQNNEIKKDDKIRPIEYVKRNDSTNPLRVVVLDARKK